MNDTMQDPHITEWGALDRYQAHYIVNIPKYDESRSGANIDIFAKTKLETSGHFASKRVTSVSWVGNTMTLLDKLNKDTELNEMIAKQSVWNAEIHIEQTNDNIRIYGRWNDKATFRIDQDVFEIYDKIAGHIKASCLPPV